MAHASGILAIASNDFSATTNPVWNSMMILKQFRRFMMAVVVSYYVTDTAHSNLIQNGSFEQPELTTASGYMILDRIPGWIGGGGGIELQADDIGRWTARGIADGEQFAELDTDENSLMYQDVPTQGDTTYLLSFSFAPRQLDNRPPNSNDLVVLWEGREVALLGGPSVRSAFRQEQWLTHSYELIAGSETGFSRLQFQALGPADGKGGLIDRVSLVQVPEPSARVLTILGIGAIILYLKKRFVQL